MSKLDIEATKFKRRYSNYRDQLPDIGHENGVFVFPYELRSGYLNRTESGYVWSDDEVNEHTFFQKLITGKDNINVVWENSTTLTKPKGVNRYYYKFEVGKYYLGEIVGNEVFANTQFYDDELGQKNIKVNNTVVLHFVYNEENDYEKDFPNLKPFIVKKEDMFKLYKIPQLFGEEWMYISDVRYETIPNDNEIVGCFITFISLNEQLSKSGRTIESYIHESAPNEPYAKPLLSVDKNEKGEIVPCVKLDESAKSFDRRMVKHLQIEIYGTNALSAITVIGRRLKKDEDGNPYFTNWQFLLPHGFIKAKTYDLEKTSTPSNNFYIFPNCELEFTKSIGWIEQWKKVSDVVATNSFTGILKIGSKNDWEGEVHRSNPINTSSSIINGLHFDYWSLVWTPFSNLQVSQPYDLTKDNPYCVNNLWFTNNDSFLDILIKNSFIYWQQLELPLGFAMTKPYKLSNLPIFGGMVSALAGDRTLFSNIARKKTIPLCCIIDCAAATCGANILVGSEGSVDIKSIPLSFFGGEEVPKFLGADKCNTTLCFSLTHLLVDSNGTEWDTSLLGQIKDGDGHPLFRVFQYDGTQKPKKTDECYIIDKVIIQGLIKSDIKITFFDENEQLANPLWTTKVQSQGKYTNSLRNWTTEITTGCWNEKYTNFEEEFTWPDFPVYGIIYNQKPNYSPYVKTNVSGSYVKQTNNGETFDGSKEVDIFSERVRINFADIDSTGGKIYNKETLKQNVKSITFILEYYFGLSSPYSSTLRLNKSNTIAKTHDFEYFSDDHYSYDSLLTYSNFDNKPGVFIPYLQEDTRTTRIESDEFDAWEITMGKLTYSICGFYNGVLCRYGLHSELATKLVEDSFDGNGFDIRVICSVRYLNLDKPSTLLGSIGFYYIKEYNLSKFHEGKLSINVKLTQINFELKDDEE